MNLTKPLENLSNIAIIGLAVILVGFLVRNCFFVKPQPARAAVGDSISVPEINFPESEHTLLIALRPDCHFCQESTGFYQRLVRLTTDKKKVRIVALFNQNTSDNNVLLGSMMPRFPDVNYTPFANLKIDATPTILDIDNSGTVQAVWRGKLQPEKENDLIKSLGMVVDE